MSEAATRSPPLAALVRNLRCVGCLLVGARPHWTILDEDRAWRLLPNGTLETRSTTEDERAEWQKSKAW